MCVTSRAEMGAPSDPKTTRTAPGRNLLDLAMLKADRPAARSGAVLRGTECLSPTATRGCNIVMRCAGNGALRPMSTATLTPETQAETVARMARPATATPTEGLVPWRERPEHFRKNCVARIPPHGGPPQGLTRQYDRTLAKTPRHRRHRLPWRSGKTTLISPPDPQNPQGGRRLAVVVNEFGDAGGGRGHPEGLRDPRLPG